MVNGPIGITTTLATANLGSISKYILPRFLNFVARGQCTEMDIPVTYRLLLVAVHSVQYLPPQCVIMCHSVCCESVPPGDGICGVSESEQPDSRGRAETHRNNHYDCLPVSSGHDIQRDVYDD